MKKTTILTIAAVLSVSLILAGCAVSTGEEEETAVSLSEIEFETKQTDESTAAVLEPSSVPVTSGSLFENITEDSEIFLGYTSSGEFVPVDTNEAESYLMAKYMTSREHYEELSEHSDEYAEMSYEEFKDTMRSFYDIDPAVSDKFSEYEIFVNIQYYSDNESTDHTSAAETGFELFAEKFRNEFKIDKLGDEDTVYVGIDQYGDAISVTAGYYDKSGDACYIMQDELACIYGDGYVIIGSTAVPADTRSLFITNITEGYQIYPDIFDDHNEDEYDAAVLNYSVKEASHFAVEETESHDPPAGYGYISFDRPNPLDLSDFAEKFPYLEKLRISSWVGVTGIEGLEKCGNLRELNISLYCFGDENDITILSGLSNIEKLHVCDVYSKEAMECVSASKAKTLAVECDCDDDILEYIYTLPNITELTINAGYPSDDPCLTGIGALTDLKKLYINTYPDALAEFDGVPDFAPLSELKNLEELRIIGNNGVNFESIGKIKSLKKLTMYGIEYDENGEAGVDLSVFSNCDTIEYLDICNIDNSIFSALPSMTNLKTVKFGAGCDFYGGLKEVSEVTSLEELIFEDTTVDLNGIEKLKNLKSLTINNCFYGKLPEAAKCPELKTLKFSFKNQSLFDAETLKILTNLEELYLENVSLRHYSSFKNLTSLKKLTINSSDITEEQLNELRSEMTWCEIEADTVSSETSSDTESVSPAEPDETVYIDDVRIDIFNLEQDGYKYKKLYIKNQGDGPLENLPEFLDKNGFAADCTEITVNYPKLDEYTEATEIYDVSDDRIDFESYSLYLSVLSDPDSEYAEKKLFRILEPEREASVILHLKND